MKIIRPDDFHVHFRQIPALNHFVRDCAKHFHRALAMPNTLPPVTSPDTINAYRHQILSAAAGYPDFHPLMTFKVMPAMAHESPEATVADLKKAGAVAGKLYPQGATTNSADGVQEVEALYPLFKAMENQDMVLCIHGEDPQAFSLDREARFLPVLDGILSNFPRLRVVLEHVTSAAGIQRVLEGPANLGATVTIHHLLSNLDDMVGGHLNPHLFCKPILKRPEDQEALRAAVLGPHPRIFFGSDSAPHAKTAKECDCGAAGVYTMPVALPLLVDFFSRHGSTERLEAFTARNGARFYGLPESSCQIEVREQAWLVPHEMNGVVPYMAGKEIPWSVVAC